MRRLIEKRLLKNFGLEDMGFFWSRTMEEFKEEIIFSIKNNQMLAISGEIGAGKSILFNEAVSELKDKTRFVYVQNYFKEHVNISSIINALIYDISNESPKRDLEARSRQALRIIGKKTVNENQNICLVVEEAHRLHANTLRALKELREAAFAGRSNLFSVVLIGHPELMAKLESRKEAYLRSQTVELNENSGWMNFNERVTYIKKVFGEAIDDTARKRIAALHRFPLEIDFYVESKMREARKAGKKKLDAETIQPSAAEIKEAHGISLKEIADESGLGKTTVHDVLHSATHAKAPEVKAAIERLVSQKTGNKVNFSKVV